MRKQRFHISSSFFKNDFDTHFKVFHELMSNKVLEILLVASPYDAYILEEDGSLAAKIIHEYRGLNLSRPPRITHAETASEAINKLESKAFHLVIAMPHLDDMDAFDLGRNIKKHHPKLPVVLLAHSIKGIFPFPEEKDRSGIDRVFIWSGDSDLLLAIVKSTEDTLNVAADTKKAMVRVLIFVDDSPLYTSYFLPFIYKEVVKQTQVVIRESLNHEHRILKMRARPKILIAENYEEAMGLYNQYKDFVFGIISDTRFPKDHKVTADAGGILLSKIRKERPDLPLLLISSEPHNKKTAERIPAQFLDKNSPSLLKEIRQFFLGQLGFGDFIFRNKDGKEIARASNLKTLEEVIPKIPDESLFYNATQNRFSGWIMARSEIPLASILREADASDFSSTDEIRQFLIDHIHGLRKWRQQGVTVNFSEDRFDPEVFDFVKIGEGSLGGKARGLAFVSNLLMKSPEFKRKYSMVYIGVPKSLVITADGFDAFVASNGLEWISGAELPDKTVTEHFLNAKTPDWLMKKLFYFLKKVKSPLSVRSSGLLEDAHHHSLSGLYKTFMIPNNHQDINTRVRHLETAIKHVYASTWHKSPKIFKKNTAYRVQKEQMAVLIQSLVGDQYGDYFYPAISGVAQSYNFYPVDPLKGKDGVARIGMGFGRGVLEGDGAIRFCPKYPSVLPQFSKTEDILNNAQRKFYALKMKDYPEDLYFHKGVNLEKRDMDDAQNEFPVTSLSSTYIFQEERIRDTTHAKGAKILTFAPVLKYKTFPLSDLLSDLLAIGRKGMGCPVEIEFSVNLSQNKQKPDQFYILQLRPMSVGQDRFDVEVTASDRNQALCYSTQALGHGKTERIRDILYVDPIRFDPSETVRIAEEIGIFNSKLKKSNRPYLLIGPGRWGSFDRWLGIPVKWKDINGAGIIIELRNDKLKADPSHGSHFFQQITSNDIPYLTITEGGEDFIDWDRMFSYPHGKDGHFLSHACLESPLLVKCDGEKSMAMIRESRCRIDKRTCFPDMTTLRGS